MSIADRVPGIKLEELYRLIVMAVPEGIWIADPQGRTIFNNKHMAEILGAETESLADQTCFDCVYPEELEEAQRQFAKGMAGSRQPFDFRLRRNDGSPVWVSISCGPLFDDSGAVAGVLGLFTDITERKRAEARLRESEARFRHVADSAPVMVWVSGPDKLCTFVNKFWLDFTGRTEEQELGNGWAENVHPEDVDRCLEIYRSSFDARRSFQMEYRLRRADGEYRWLLDNGVPQFESGGIFAGYIGSCADVTDLKNAHEDNLVKQKLESVGALAGGIAHDFNNLLGAILALSELALSDLEAGANPMKELRLVRDTAIRGAEIVQQLMVYSGQESEELSFVDLSRIVEEMRALLSVSVSKRVAIETDLGELLPAVRANPAQLRQVVMNLITNASEAIGERTGVIRITTRRVTVGGDSRAEIQRGLSEGEYVQLEVSDTGRGMTLQEQAKVFSGSFTTKVRGIHGLGLATVQAIVQRLNGATRFSSARGTGTTFQILLPGEDRVWESNGEISYDEDATVISQPATVLVVEDEAPLREGVSTILRKKGFTVIEAGDGSSAVEVLRKYGDDIDVLLLDVTLPGASSREVFEEAKRLRPKLQLIVTSAKSIGVATDSLGITVERFLRKPFRLVELVGMVRDSLPRG